MFGVHADRRFSTGPPKGSVSIGFMIFGIMHLGFLDNRRLQIMGTLILSCDRN